MASAITVIGTPEKELLLKLRHGDVDQITVTCVTMLQKFVQTRGI